MNTSLKVDSWTRIIILNKYLPVSQAENALAVILAGAQKLAMFKSLNEWDLSPRILSAIAPCVHTISMQEAGNLADLMVQKSDGILYHLVRFEQLRRLALQFLLDSDANTMVLPLAALDLPRLESISLKLEKYDSIDDAGFALVQFGTDFFVFLARSHLPSLRRVHVDFEYEEGDFEPVSVNLIDALASFFAGHQDLDFARLCGCDPLFSQVLPGLGALHLELFWLGRVPVMIGTTLHPLVAKLSLKSTWAPFHIPHPMWSWLEDLPQTLVAHAPLRAVDIMDLHHDGDHVHFDGKTVLRLSHFGLARGPLYTERKANDDRLMRVACTLAEKGVALRVIGQSEGY
jgi:hypothetical protein